MDCFEWDEDKDRDNQAKHGISFRQACEVFMDPRRIIVRDVTHSMNEDRYFCIGRAGDSIVTVRFTWREHVIRIIGAGRWRRGKKIYEEKNQIH